jgi:MFS transporter, PAT family, beta-lactamase induction signal transducer AmpG
MIIEKSSNPQKATKKSPWLWIPTLYFAEGLPYIIVTSLSVVMYKRFGISNSDIAFYTSWLYLPWVIKPLWGPLVDFMRTKKLWILSTQLVIGAALAGIAFTIPIPDFFQFTLAFFWLLAFSSATHDIAADGFYMLALKESQQSYFVGIRNSFYRVAIISGQSLLVILAGQLEGAFSVGSAEFKIVANPNKFFQETIKVDSIGQKSLPGIMRIIPNTTYLEISTRPKTKTEINFYKDYAHRFNIMNGFINDLNIVPDTTSLDDLDGNVGIISFYLSKKPSQGSEYNVILSFLEGNEGIKVIEGRSLKFTSENWNKPAFAVFQLDPSIAKKSVTIFKIQSDRVSLAWMIIMIFVGGIFLLLFFYHRRMLPEPGNDRPAQLIHHNSFIKEYFRTFFRFFEKKKIILSILFLLFYRFGEAQLTKMSALFMLDGRETGGLGLSTSELGFVNSAGVFTLIIGGLLGGFLVAKKGLKFWLWPMLLAINLPHLLYVYMAYAQPTNIWIISACVAGEQLGYGFGFTAYIMYMIFISEGEYKTSHYAIATGFMALSMMIPGLFSGMIQEVLGYKMFFLWIMLTIIPSIIIVKFLPIEYSFGKKKLSD